MLVIIRLEMKSKDQISVVVVLLSTVTNYEINVLLSESFVYIF